MRETLFRGKRIDNGEWVYGYYAKYRNIRNEVYTAILQYDECEGDVYSDGIVAVIPETVGQYTGLTDMNGKKIFEGDIIQYKTEYDVAPIYSYVVYCADTYDYPAFDLEQHAYETNGLQSACRECLCEVIGNKWDNPELLEVEE